MQSEQLQFPYWRLQLQWSRWSMKMHTHTHTLCPRRRTLTHPGIRWKIFLYLCNQRMCALRTPRIHVHRAHCTAHTNFEHFTCAEFNYIFPLLGPYPYQVWARKSWFLSNNQLCCVLIGFFDDISNTVPTISLSRKMALQQMPPQHTVFHDL